MLHVAGETVALSIPGNRVSRLALHAEAGHCHLRRVLAAALPFRTRARYSAFLSVQYSFAGEVQPIYEHPLLHVLLPDVSWRSSLDLIVRDITDLSPGGELPSIDLAPSRCEDDWPWLLGWLFVAEGISLYGPTLYREAVKLGLSPRHGARHLSGEPELRLQRWRAFVRAVNELALSGAEEGLLSAGTDRALGRLQALASEVRL
ncbi:biliverdin-producing heme oxygenase [Agrobacterium tumefaciens]|uniref:biliverdin-producing heme oxygenase n=1 Tax=Agrobacterium tumefaciens TaxID=358 RepID=UPI0021D2DE9C|nr:biliverdin-producing heme oxygenase [Agrobacterium tumefaciens]UXS01843.1 biliverdin-producing heme oxygenase [Agrobacterium tumefaciens]